MESHLPEHLLAKIFLPLSTKSLLRSRCVCKFWDQVINNKFFINAHQIHHKNSLDTNKYLLTGCGPSYLTCLVDSESYNNVFETHEYDLTNICGRNLANYPLEPYGFCNGLLCLSHAEKDLYPDYPVFLWNPVVRKAKKLPPLDIQLEFIQRSCLCFGYHDDDYKVVNVVPLKKAYHVYVYSLSTDSWKFLKFAKKSDHADKFEISAYLKARFVNGAAYLVPRDESSRGIVCFDLNCEIIRQINLPDGLIPRYIFMMEEYQESIAIVESSSQNVVMWVLRVSDNSTIVWDRKDVFEVTMENEYEFRALGFMNKDKFVVKRRNRRRMIASKYFLCNVENGFSQAFTTPERVDRSGHDEGCPKRIYELTESLVLLTESSTPCEKMEPCSAADKQDQKSREGKRHSWKKS